MLSLRVNFSRLQTEVPRSLYHYTSLEALVSIVQTRKLRASNIRFLNDSSESLWLKQHAVFILRKQASAQPQQPDVKGIVEAIESWPLQSHFVASFTEKSDDLSQWRAYCPLGQGVSIGLATECLQQQFVANPRGGEPHFLSASLNQVQYYSENEESLLEEALSKLLLMDASAAEEAMALEVAKSRNLNSVVDRSPDSLILMFQAISALPATSSTDREQFKRNIIPVWLNLISPYFKHHAFAGELEWRKVISKDHRPILGLQFRQSKSTLVPFVEIMLDMRLEGAKRVPQSTYFIKDIVGPTPTPDLTVEAVRALFFAEGHPDVVVRKSDIPFRSW